MPRPRVNPLTATIAEGDRRKSLVAIRDRVANELLSAEGRDVAVLSKELREVMRELDGMPSEERVTPLDRLAGAVEDDLAKRRAARVADAAGP